MAVCFKWCTQVPNNLHHCCRLVSFSWVNCCPLILSVGECSFLLLQCHAEPPQLISSCHLGLQDAPWNPLWSRLLAWKKEHKTMLSNEPFSSIGKPCISTPLGKPEMRAPRQMMGSSWTGPNSQDHTCNLPIHGTLQHARVSKRSSGIWCCY